MIINEAGEYTLQYTATDACGNSTTVERDLVVEAPPRTVLYTDGTLIINELSRDIDANVQAHGQPLNVYIPFDPNGATDIDKYIFGSYTDVPWVSLRNSITSVEAGSSIQPTSTAFWFYGCANVESIDFANIDTKHVTNMKSMFSNCNHVQSFDFDTFDTSAVTNMSGMFYACSALTVLDLSVFDTKNVTDMSQMFRNNQSLTTIYVSENFITSQVTSSNMMFYNMSTNLVGGAGTVWNSSYTDKTRAKIDGGTSDPGYFTAKS